MTEFYKRAYNELENKINELLIEQENQLASFEKVIAIIVQKLGKLKEYVLKTDFKNQQEEIHFFKHLKPQFIAKLNSTLFFKYSKKNSLLSLSFSFL